MFKSQIRLESILESNNNNNLFKSTFDDNKDTHNVETSFISSR